MGSELPYIRGIFSRSRWLLGVLGLSARLRLANPGGGRSPALLALSMIALTLVTALVLLLPKWFAGPTPATLADNPGEVQQLELAPAPDTEPTTDGEQRQGVARGDVSQQATPPPKADETAAGSEVPLPAESPSPPPAASIPAAREAPEAQAAASTTSGPEDTASPSVRRLGADHITIVAHRRVRLEVYQGTLPHRQELLLERYLESGEDVELTLPSHLRVDDGGAVFLLAAGQDLGPLGAEGIPLEVTLLPPSPSTP